MGIIKKLLDRLLPPTPPPPPDKTGQRVKDITVKTLLDELVVHFKADMDDHSGYTTVIFPMSFNILLHPDDYARLGETLPFILPEVVSNFYAAIKEKRDGIQGAVVVPPATFWFFQFAASKVKTEGREDKILSPGEIITVGHLTTFDIKKAQRGKKTENPKLSVKCINSDVNQNNINPDALLGMEILAEGTYSFPFDKGMSENLNDIRSSRRGGSALATLTYSLGTSTFQLTMDDDFVILSGPKEKRNMENILIVDSEAVAVDHVHIRYDRDKNQFQLCAYAKTRLNMSEVPLSVGGAPVWVDMSFRSSIFLNDEVNVKFKASDSLFKG